MALASGTLFNVQATATTGNVNGSGFNPLNAAFPTDLTTDSNTANTASPVVSSATYTFVAGDVGAYLFVKAGTNWIPGFYPIVSVAGGKATLNATIGSAIIANPVTGVFDTASTVTGCATVGTPTNGTYGVNYSMLDTAPVNGLTDFNAVGASTTLTSASGPFTPVMVGNFFHQTTTGTGAFGVVGWYEVATYVSATTVTLDRTPNSGTASVNTTGYVGGAGRLNGLEDAMFEAMPASAMIFVKTGTYTLSGNINVASTAGTSATPIYLVGYTTIWGDSCTGTSRPLFACGASTFIFSTNAVWRFRNIRGTTTAAAGFSTTTSCVVSNHQWLNSSTTAARLGMTIGTDGSAINCEAVSQNGIAMSMTSRVKVSGNYLHDSVTGLSSLVASAVSITGNVIANCDTNAILTNAAVGSFAILNNTLYGREAKIGTGINFSAITPSSLVANNIIYGFATGVLNTTTQQDSNVSMYNDFYNNTTDATLFAKGRTDLAVDPQFSGATQVTGTTATTSASVLTQSGGDFSSVEDSVDYLHVISGTGVTTGIYLITSHTSTTLTVNNALGTSSGGDVVYYVSTGHNFSIGTNLKSIGFPQFTDLALEFVGYPDVGAIQSQPTGSGTSGNYVIGA